MFPNTLHNDKWYFTFSNIPTITDLKDMRYFDNYVKSFILPDYNMDIIYSEMPGGFRIQQPKAGLWKNKDLSQVQIEFKVSEDMRNYLFFFKWMQQLKYGQLNSSYEGWIRKYNINRGILSILDNQKRETVNVSFTEMFLLNLSSIQLTMGSSEEVTFVCNFSYEEILYEQKDVMIGGTRLTAPSLEIPCGTSGLNITTSADWS